MDPTLALHFYRLAGAQPIFPTYGMLSVLYLEYYDLHRNMVKLKDGGRLREQA